MPAIPEGFRSNRAPEPVQRAGRTVIRAARRRNGVDRPRHRGRSTPTRAASATAACSPRSPTWRWATPCCAKSRRQGKLRHRAPRGRLRRRGAQVGDWIESSVEIQRVGARLAFANCYLVVGGRPHRAGERHLRPRRKERMNRDWSWRPGCGCLARRWRCSPRGLRSAAIACTSSTTAAAARTKPTSTPWRALRARREGPVRRP